MDQDQLRAEIEDALFTAAQVGTTDYVCRGCFAAVEAAPVLACPCGCDNVMDRICGACGTAMTAVRRQ